MYGWVQNIAADQRSAEPQEDIPLAVEGQEIALNIYFRNNFPPNDAGFLFTIETGGTAVGTDIRRYSNSIITIVNLERLLLVFLLCSHNSFPLQRAQITLLAIQNLYFL